MTTYQEDGMTVKSGLAVRSAYLNVLLLMCMCMCLFINMNTICMQCPWMSREGTDPLGLKIQVIISQLLWVLLGSEAGSSKRSSRALNLLMS